MKLPPSYPPDDQDRYTSAEWDRLTLDEAMASITAELDMLDPDGSMRAAGRERFDRLFGRLS
jgi:hypothetical protein